MAVQKRLAHAVQNERFELRKGAVESSEQFRRKIAFADLAVAGLFDAHGAVEVAAGGRFDEELGGKSAQGRVDCGLLVGEAFSQGISHHRTIQIAAQPKPLQRIAGDNNKKRALSTWRGPLTSRNGFRRIGSPLQKEGGAVSGATRWPGAVRISLLGASARRQLFGL